MLVILTLVTVTTAAAQDQSVWFGQRVRVSAPELSLDDAIGRFQGVRRDTLRVLADSLLRIPVGLVVRIEASRGRSNIPVLVGGIAGAAVGAAVGIALIPDCDVFDPGCEEQTLGPPVLGAVLGALIGTGLGVALRSERWENVPLDVLRVNAVPGRLYAIGASIPF